MIALYIAVGVAVAALAAWVVIRKTLRTRLKMAKALRDDPDVNDWLIVFNWTSKVLYFPTIAAALVACLLMLLRQTGFWFLGSINAEIVGGLWFAILFVNFLVEEYDISIKLLLITIVSLAFFLVWLHLLGWAGHFIRQFRHLAISISASGYFLVTVIGLLTIGISWLRGLFYYVTMTPNYMNVQEGPTETGEQIGREDYNTRVDTTDFLERLFGFGRIIITFKDKKRAPISMLVWKITKKAQMLERVRAKFAIDYPQQTPPAGQ
jgi:hypothetical protein